LAAIFIPVDGEPVFAVHRNEQVTAREATWIKDLRVYEGGEWESLKAIKFCADVLQEKGLENKKIGVELMDMPGLWLDHLRKLLPSARITDAKPVFDKLRSVKSPKELEFMGKANMATAKAITVAFEMARPGDMERELAHNMIGLTLKYGGDTVAFIHLGAGKNIFETHHMADNYKIKKGDLVHVDFGCFFDGYYSDISRTAVVGDPDDTQLKAYEVAVEAEYVTGDAMISGEKVITVHNRVKEFYESKGYKYDRAFIGHSMGIGCHELPFLGPADGDWVLEPGMFFQVEPSMVLGNARVHTEDSFVVKTKGPAEIVSEYTDVREIQIIR
jgi:Xaa-Pro aminopeptidase